jgi:hypothetical protein
MMRKLRGPALGMLILLNGVVLLGQLWPEGAPPFARTVNILFLVASFAYFISEVVRRGSSRP